MTSTSSLRLEKITPDNVAAACRLDVRPDQQDLVAPVAWSLAEAYANPETAWPRLVFDGDALVGFVMAGFDPQSPVEVFRCGIWRLNIAADHQGRGYGRFAVAAVLAEARRRGQSRATVSWVPGDHGPEKFYLKLGFRPTGEVVHGEVVGAILLSGLQD
ncbi:GNAT family N-acetyltransferase [Streptacidiphilus neutrinimicus]|uniref:GNAT family N-acetyltransferase n=1 Tax=Streptacidiphilus neutrinimicus TaxID=105420 RepID=UPI0005A5DF3E|nr:GNAT family N-acetyltransferase [Streptacidiphilus neutrinimicus]